MVRPVALLILVMGLASWSPMARAADDAGVELETVSRKVVVEPARIIGERAGVPLYATTVTSEVYTIDRILKSMQGPDGIDNVSLWSEPGPSELLWLTGFRASMVAADGESDVSPEFMCHSTLNVLDGVEYQQRFPSNLGLTGARLFTLDQGTPPVNLPAGFGIPLMSDQIVLFNSQVLNHNIRSDPFEVRQKVWIEFVRDRDLEKPLIPLLQHGVSASVLVDGKDGHFGLHDGETAEGPGCSMGVNNGVPEYIIGDGAGRKFSSFWVVPPGKHAYHTRVTTLLDLPFDTTIHYATAHLHPFAESLELRDLTTNESVVLAKASQAKQGVGLDSVTGVSSPEGIKLYRNHEYELVSTYNNTSEVDQDAMAAMFLYVRAIDLYDFDLRPRKKSF